jgi:mRNA interferase MazF
VNRNMFDPGDLVVVDFPGVTATKRRPAVIVSSKTYHSQRPDLIVGLVTSQMPAVQAATDWLLLDWAGAGLRLPSLFRSFLYTVPRSEVIARMGRLNQADWDGVKGCSEQAVGPF